MGACLSCCARVLRALRLSGRRRRFAHIRTDPMSDRSRAEIETTPVLSEESPPRGKFSDAPSAPSGGVKSSTVTPIRIDANMSSPTIKIGRESGFDEEEGSASVALNAEKRHLSGHGLALADTAVGQSGAYWEWHMGQGERISVGRSDDHESVMVGVSTKRTQEFYKILADSDGAASSLKLATKLMRTVRAHHGDTIGVAIDIGVEKPFIQLLLNGELQEEFLLGRYRGSVFPSIWLPKPDGTATATFVHDEAMFRFKSPSANFLPMSGESGKGGSIV